MKRKVVVLLLSMLLFIGVFLYGALQNIDKPSEDKKPPEIETGSEQFLENVWIISGEGSEITYFNEGGTISVETEMELSESLSNVIGDLTLENGKVQKVKVKPELISGKVISINESTIQLEIDGKIQTYPLSSQFKVYRKKENLEALTIKNILVGYNNVDFVLGEEELCAGVMEREADIHNIRVLIRTSKFEDMLHDAITFTCTTDYTVQMGEAAKSYKAGKKITVKPSSKIMASGRIVIKPEKSSGKVKLLNVERTCKNPCYRGTLEISKYEDKLTAVNELSMEEYLYAVIPSEMPTDYGDEALKVQAVCARTYAYKQLMQNEYSQYGAHIDDSVASQVYNNIAEDKNSIKAVTDTYGEVLLYENDVIEAYYFSTSWGCTADAKDVWLSEETNYLEGQIQISKDSEETMDAYDFSNDKNFKEFLNSKTITTYDSTFPWYRWNVTVPAKKLQQSIEKNIKARYEVNPNLILTLNGGKYVSQPIESIGTVESIEIANRTKSGLVNEVVIKGSEAAVKVCSEYNIRLLLAPLDSVIKRSDKSKVDTLTMLPSAFFLLTKNEDEKAYTFKGGGYGHGVGMSQNGAKAMTDSGFNYNSILQHYYKGTTIGNLYL